MAVMRCSPNTQINSPPPVMFLLYHSFGGICREKENYLIEQENERDESSVDNRDLNDSFV